MIVVTGAAGFIGSNLVAGLNAAGHTDILAVDDLAEGARFRNLRGLRIADYADSADFMKMIDGGLPRGTRIEAVLHQGACTDTMEWDGRYMLGNNFEYGKKLLRFCDSFRIPFIYASSASVYGKGESGFAEDAEGRNEYPLNVYAWSKHLFDAWLRAQSRGLRCQAVGLRYFNVFGPQEMHKGRMASMVYRTYIQLREKGFVELFEGTDGFPAGEQKRDFIHVSDVVRVNLFFLEHPEISGIFNCGTGKARSFNDVAKTLISLMGRGEIRYVPFPENLRGTYQSFTEADTARLVGAGFGEGFRPLEEAVGDYYRFLEDREGLLCQAGGTRS